MTYFKWDDSLSVGVNSIDEQHKKLIETINDLKEAIDVGKGKDIQGAMFEEITDYFMTHFKLEEEYMTDNMYPDYGPHMTLHNGFIAKIKDLSLKANTNESDVTTEALGFLVRWLISHDVIMDKKLGTFLIEHGVK